MLNTTAELQKRIILGGFIILSLIHVVFVFAGFYNNDDIVYAKYAADVAHNGISFSPASNHYQLRWPVIYTAAFFYKLFGINTFSSSLFSFASIVLCGVLLKKIANACRPVIFLLSLVFFFFAHSIIFYMHRLLPDAAMCLAVFWMYSSYRWYYINQAKGLNYGVQFSLAFFLAVLTKETIIIALPLFALFFLRDVIKKQRLRFWLYAVSTAFILIALYLLYFKITTGSFFYRYHILQSQNYFTACSFDKLPFIFTLRRIGYELWRNMLLNGDFLIFLPAVAAFVYRKKIAGYALTYKIDFYAFLILLLAANFMTISFTTYLPLCRDTRHFLFLFPFAAIIAGPMLFAYFKEPAKFFLLPVLMVCATIIMFYLQAGNTKYLYLIFSLLLTTRLFLQFFGKRKIADRVFIAAVIILFFLNYLTDFINPPFPWYWHHKKSIEKIISEKNIPATVFTADKFTAQMTEFVLQFKNDKIQVLTTDSVKTTNPGNLYFLSVGDSNPQMQKKIDSLINNRTDYNWVLIYKEQHVFLYKINDAQLQLLKQLSVSGL